MSIDDAAEYLRRQGFAINCQIVGESMPVFRATLAHLRSGPTQF